MIGLRLHSQCTKTELSSNLPPGSELTEGNLASCQLEPSPYLHVGGISHKIILVGKLGWRALQKRNVLMIPCSVPPGPSIDVPCRKDSALSGLCHLQPQQVCAKVRIEGTVRYEIRLARLRDCARDEAACETDLATSKAWACVLRGCTSSWGEISRLCRRHSWQGALNCRKPLSPIDLSHLPPASVPTGCEQIRTQRPQ